MLDESLGNFLELNLSDSMYKLYADIISYLESIEYSTIQDELLGLAFATIGDDVDREHKDENTIVDDMYAHLKSCLTTQLRLTGVTVEEHIPLQDLFSLSLGILNIAHHEDIAGIIACASSDEAPPDQLADVLALVTAQPSDHWILMLETVSDDLIKRIRELSTEVVNKEYQEMEETAEYLQRLRVYAQYVLEKDRSLIVLGLVGSLILGQELETYIQSGVLNDLFEGNEMHKLALELYCMCMMSSDAKQDPTNSVRAVIEKYLNDSVRIVQFTAEFGKVNAEFIKFFQTSTKQLKV